MMHRKRNFLALFLFLDFLLLCVVLWDPKGMESQEWILSAGFFAIGILIKLGIIFDSDEDDGTHGGYG